jgi:hypothetical protein
VIDDVCEDFVGNGKTGGNEGRKEGRRSGYKTKNKNPTRQCGEIKGNIII